VSDTSFDQSGMPSSIPSSSAADAGVSSGRASVSPPARNVRSTSSRRSGGLLQQRPVLLAIGGIFIAALLFGGGFLAGRDGAAISDLEQTTIGVISTVDPSVVQVQGRGSGSGGSIGSGEILTSNGYIVTNSHVVHGLSSYSVLLSNGQTVTAKLMADVPDQDLAVLKVAATNLKPISVGDSSQVQVGEYAIAMGSPLGLEQSATSGIVSALDRDGTEVVNGKPVTLTGMIQTSAPINPGNSGGALVNSRGQLIGIPTLSAVEPATKVAANGIGFAIASNKMESIVARYIPAGS
jgi:S1-C subfamily serine protease